MNLTVLVGIILVLIQGSILLLTSHTILYHNNKLDFGNGGLSFVDQNGSSNKVAAAKYVPVWSAHPTIQDVFVSCASVHCGMHLASMPPSFWKELQHYHFRVVYVVGDGTVAITALDEIARTVHEVESITNLPIAILSLTQKETYPNVEKDMATLLAFAKYASKDQIFIHADTDTVFVPSRLAAMLSPTTGAVSKTDPNVYIGRPISSCECSLNAKNCTFDNSVFYCSGTFYITNKATLQRITNDFVYRPAPNMSIAKIGDDPNKAPECRSSDLSIGYMMNKQLGLTCTPFRDPSLPKKWYPGRTWPLTKDPKDKKTVTSAICQQFRTPGGIHDRKTLSRPFSIDDAHRADCVAYHPVKQRADMLYAWNMLYHGKDDPSDDDVVAGERYGILAQGGEGNTTTCPLAIYIPVLPKRYDIRQTIRLTWGKSAKSLGMIIRFVVGYDPDPLQMTSNMIKYENSTYGDIITSPQVEGYGRIPLKIKVAFQHAVASTQCAAFARVDADTYFRPYQAYKLLEVLEKQHVDGSEFYVGHIWDAKKSKRANVVKDPNHPWYIGYNDSDYYPPYANEYTYLMSMTLARKVEACYTQRSITGMEGIHVGICVEKVQHPDLYIINAPQLSPDSNCTIETVTDSRVLTSEAYNVLQRHEAHLNNQFCSLGTDRKFATPHRKHLLTVNAFDVTAVDPNIQNGFLKRILAPWDIPYKPDQYIFQVVDDVEKQDYKLTSHNAKQLHTIFKTSGGGSKSQVVQSYRCLNCIENWYTTIRFPKTTNITVINESSIKTESVMIVSGTEARFGQERVLKLSFDIGVMHGCDLQKIIEFGQELRTYPTWDMNLIVTTTCTSKGERDQIKDALLNTTGWDETRIKLLPLYASLLSSLSYPMQSTLYKHARYNSVMMLCHPGTRFDAQFLIRSTSFVQSGRTVYFPIAFTSYEESMVRIVEDYFNTNNENDEGGKAEDNEDDLDVSFYGKYNPSNVDIHLISGRDARTLSVSLNSIQVTSPQNTSSSLYQNIQSKLNIIRMQDANIVVLNAGYECNVPASEMKSCIIEKGQFIGSPLAVYLRYVLNFSSDDAESGTTNTTAMQINKYDEREYPKVSILYDYPTRAVEMEIAKHDRLIVESLTYMKGLTANQTDQWTPSKDRTPTLCLNIFIRNRSVQYMNALFMSLMVGQSPERLNSYADINILNVERRPERIEFRDLKDIEDKLKFAKIYNVSDIERKQNINSSAWDYRLSFFKDTIRGLEVCYESGLDWCLTLEDDAVTPVGFIDSLDKFVIQPLRGKENETSDITLYAYYNPVWKGGKRLVWRNYSQDEYDIDRAKLNAELRAYNMAPYAPAFEVKKTTYDFGTVAQLYPRHVIPKFLTYLKSFGDEPPQNTDYLMNGEKYFRGQYNLSRLLVEPSLVNHIGFYSDRMEGDKKGGRFQQLNTDVRFNFDAGV